MYRYIILLYRNITYYNILFTKQHINRNRLRITRSIESQIPYTDTDDKQMLYARVPLIFRAPFRKICILFAAQQPGSKM